jgi:hypothetical protein
MDLQYPKYTSEIQDIENRLKELSLQYSVEERVEIPYPVMLDGKTAYTGLIEIMAFIDQLANESHQWWYCGC